MVMQCGDKIMKEGKNYRGYCSPIGIFLIAWSMCCSLLLYAQPTVQDYNNIVAQIKNINAHMQIYAQKKGLVVCLVDSRIADAQLREGRDVAGTNMFSRFFNHLGAYLGTLFNRVRGEQGSRVRYDEQGNLDAEILPGDVCGMKGCLLSVRRLCALGLSDKDLAEKQTDGVFMRYYKHAGSLHIIVDRNNQNVMPLLKNLGVEIAAEASEKGFFDARLKPQTPAGVQAAQDAVVPVRVILCQIADAQMPDEVTRGHMPTVNIVPLQEALAGLRCEAQRLFGCSQSEPEFLMKAVYGNLRLRNSTCFKTIQKFVLPADTIGLALRMRIAVGFFDAYMIISPEKLPEMYEKLRAEIGGIQKWLADQYQEQKEEAVA